VTDSEGLNAALDDLKATTNGVGHYDLSSAADGDGRLDDVLLPVTAGGGDIAGQREVGQGRERNVVGTADAGLEHAAAPDRNAPLGGRVVNGDGFAEAADSPALDVDDAAGFHVDRGESVAAVADGLVEADGGVEALLQQGVEVEVVVPEGLLDHKQVELLPVGDAVRVTHVVSGVGVATESDVGPAVADGLEDFGIPTRLALQLDALVASGEFGGDLVHEALERAGCRWRRRRG